MVKVSIIVPVYNVEKYLNKCLDSLVNQTLKDIEVICDLELLDNVIDEFGEDSIIRLYDRNHFSLKTNKDLEGFKRYILRNLDMVQVISPLKLKKEIEGIIKYYLNNSN